ncbi:UNVERIFIED_CONTAM: putative inactive receptor kinase [Sesamum radiatum]|uniref:Inactive receptor kinase n=1 Tax=Sesamum radiatum TaxID=300843 RepID=A0AAW2KZT5_SESRA
MEKLQVFALCFLVGSLYLLSVVQGSVAATFLESDKQALLDFASKFTHLRPLNWNEQYPVCKNWTGVTCSEDGNRVISVRLPGVGFHGPIPENTLSRLSALQILSLRSNGITGTFPLDFGNLKNLTFLYLQHNDFSGPLPVDFSVWRNLTIVNLSNNGFNGSIPRSLSSLNQLIALNLANNSFSGELPDLNLPSLQLLNLSHNNLVGSVPKSLHRFPKSVFLGNSESLLDYTVTNSPIVLAPHEHNPRAKTVGKLSERALLGIVIAGSVLVLLGFGFLLLVCILRRKTVDGFAGKLEKGDMSPEKAISRSQDAILGKGTFGTAYKAILEDATMVVVKRLKDVNVGKREFEQQMDVIGSIKHENVIELRAYYYSKDEKLMVYDYYSQGSVASMLHGKRGDNRTPLDWETRVNVAIAAARGIARIHMENGGKLVHGNVKSSNIFLNSRQFGCVSDLGLSTIMSSLAPPIARAAGYRAPELTDTRKATQPSDVYSFGVILLELLTEVFDVELLRYPNIEEELVDVTDSDGVCVVRMPDQRPKMSEVVKMIENVRLAETNRASSEVKSENSTPMPLSSPGH